MSNMNQIASDLYKVLTESDSRKQQPYDTKAEVQRVEDDIAWVKIPGGVDETPVQKTNNANPGDTVMVRVAGGRAWLLGNNTSPATDDTRAEQAYTVGSNAGAVANVAIKNAQDAQTAAERALSDAETAHIAAEEAKEDAATANTAAIEAKADAADAKVDAATAHTAATEAKADAATANTAANQAKTDAATANTAANQAKADAATANTSANQAKADAATAQTSANEAKADAAEAHTAANNAIRELGTIEDVVGTVTWAAEHSGQDMADYINSHLALTTYGLDLVLDNTSYRIHIGTHTASGDDGVYVIDDQGHVVSFFGEDIKFDSGHAQYIGNNNAYIVFDPAGNDGQGSLTIGGSSIQMGNRSLNDILENTLIYDHTYEYVVNSSGKKTGATFTAFLYRGGIDIKSEYDPTCFSWYVKKEDTDGQTKETLLGTGYTITVSLSSCGYGAEIIGKCTIADDADVLNNAGDNLTNSDGDNLSVRATGESIRVRDLTVSTVIFPSEQIMIVGASDEHLVSVQTLQDYLNQHLDKQVLFDTTANWNSQTTLVSDASKLYIYTDYKYDSQGNAIAGIKAGDGNAFVCDLPFVDAIATEHIANNTVHITANERTFWNNKVRCYYAGTEQLIFTTA